MGLPRVKRFSNRFLFAFFVLSGLLILSLFTPTYLIPVEKPVDARNIFLIDHGTHSSLALETATGALVRYAYGDKRYYANRDTSLASGAAALLIPTPATMGRAELTGPANIENLQRQLVVGVEKIYPLQVDAAKVDSLIEKLDKLHSEGRSDHIVVETYGLVFAPHPADYHWANNSSTVIAKWLEELGVEVFGWRLTATWRLL
jgi:hypothetical protein